MPIAAMTATSSLLFRPILAALLAVILLLAPLAVRHASAEQAGAAAATGDGRLLIRTSQGEFPFSVELADEPGEQARGLMFRETMAADHAMLFDFGEPRPVSMWMKNTPMSLDMVFARPDGTVVHIAERTEPFSEKIIASPEPVSHVLEIRAGISRMIGLKPGDRLVHSSFGD